MNSKQFDKMGKKELREACKGCGITGYSKMTVAQMREEVKQHQIKAEATKGTGLKIEKDREERNGIKRPSVGGVCREVWDFCDDVKSNTGKVPSAAMVRDEAERQKWNANNAMIEMYQWRRFNGIRGRQS